MTDSGLIAIGLVIRSGAGPRFVFHHPPHPTDQASQREARFGTELDLSDEDDLDRDVEDSDGSEPEDGGNQLNQSVGKLNLGDRRKQRHVGPIPGDDHYDASSGEQIVPWEYLGEFATTDLEMILTPSRPFHKKKFELSLDPLYFVSYPMHIREDGLWKKKRLKKVKKAKKEISDAGSGDGKMAEKKSEKPDKEVQDDSDDVDNNGEMTMFNIVFVLNLPKDEADERILIYEPVIKKFNKALKHAQAQDGFVWRQSEMILAMKEKAREERMFTSLWKITANMIRSSDELAMEPNIGPVEPCWRDQRRIYCDL